MSEAFDTTHPQVLNMAFPEANFLTELDPKM